MPLIIRPTPGSVLRTAVRPNVPLVLSSNGGVVAKLLPTAGVNLSRLFTYSSNPLFPPGAGLGLKLAASSDGRDLFALALGGAPMRYNALAGDFAVLGSRNGEVNLAGTVDIALDRNGTLYGVKSGFGGDQLVFRFDLVDQQYFSLALAGRWQRDGGDDGGNLSIAVGPDGRIYVAGRYEVLRLDDIFGRNLMSYGSFGSGNGQFRLIESIAVDSQSRVVVSDSGNRRVVRFAVGEPRWDVFDLAAYGGPASTFEPVGVGVDTFQRVYVAVPGMNAVLRIDNFARGQVTSFRFKDIFQTGRPGSRDPLAADYLPGPVDVVALDPDGDSPAPRPR